MELLVLAILIFPQALALYAGDNCRQPDGEEGVCQPFSNCQSALRGFRKGFRPHECGYDKFEPIVCCSDSSSITMRKSDFECNSYTNELLNFATPFILDGREALPGEFPHMAALGYYTDASDPTNIEWRCGGTLISDQYVLTAAHCVANTTRSRPPKKAFLGVIDLRKNNEPGSQMYDIEEVIRHPNYSIFDAYNDIALLKLSRKVHFTDKIFPACLHTKPDVDSDTGFVITGWGKMYNGASRVNQTLQTATVASVNLQECKRRWPRKDKVKRMGVIDSMICARDPEGRADTCDGDSGGPLQIRPQGRNQYVVVGVTSYGPSLCGGPQPTLYTRVYSFLDWIESTVWP